MSNLIDKIRTSILIFNIVFILSELVLKISFLLPSKKKRVKENFDIVETFSKEISGYINGQNVGEISKLPFGKNTIGYCGCGAIATYNSLKTLECQKDFAEWWSGSKGSCI